MKKRSSWVITPAGTECQGLKALREVASVKFASELLAESLVGHTGYPPLDGEGGVALPEKWTFHRCFYEGK